MITVHHLNNSRSQRVLWLLEELGLPYELKTYMRDPATLLAPPELKAVHPLGKSPVLTDGNAVIAETGAIFEYLLAKAGHHDLCAAAGSDQWLRLRYWMHYAEGSAMPPLLLKLVFMRLPRQVPWFMRGLAQKLATGALAGFVEPQLKLHQDYWEKELAATGWFAGSEFSAADIMMSFPVEVAASRGSARTRPVLTNFLKAIHARPAYQRALETGGQYAYAEVA